MAGELGTLTAKLALESAAFNRDMGRAAAAVKSESAKMNRAMKGIQKSARNVQRQFSQLRIGIAALGLGLVVRDIIKTSAEFQKLQSSLKTVTGSTKAANAAFSEIKNFAATTPFDLQQVTGAFIKLKALGMDPSMDALKSYGNTASAMGKSLNDMVEAIADAATGEFERLKEFGIKAKSQGDKVTFTFQKVATTVGKNAAEIEGYLRKIGNVQFAGAMEREAATLGGALSNLSDSFAVFQNEVGEGGLSDAVADFARQTSEAAAGAESLAQTIGSVLGASLTLVTENMREITAAVAAFVAYKVATVFTGIAIAVGGYVKAVVTATTVTKALNVAMTRNPAGLLAVGISSAVAALILFNDEADKITLRGANQQLDELGRKLTRQVETLGDLYTKQLRGGSSKFVDQEIVALTRQTKATQALIEKQKTLVAEMRLGRARSAAPEAPPKGIAGASTTPASAVATASDAIKKEGQRLTEALDPIAKYNAEIERFKKLHDLGSLSLENFSKAVQQAQNNMQTALSEAMLPMTAAEQTDPFGDFSRGAQEAEQRTRDLAKATRDQADAFKAEGQRLTEALDPIAKYNAEVARFRELMDAGAISQKTFGDAVERAQKDMQKAQEQTDKMSDAAKELGLTFTSAFEDAIVSGKKFSDVLRSLGEDILRLLVRKTVTEPGADALSGVFGKILDGILGGPTGGIGGGLGDLGGVGKATALSGLGFFASGGRHGGGFRVVGENGPELEATGPSRIYSASQTADMLGGSSGGTTVYIDARGSNGDAAVEAAVERGIRRAAPGIVGAAVHKVRDGARRDPRMFR